MEEAMRVFPGLAPGDSFLVNDGKTRLSLEDAADGIKTIYQQLLDQAWSDAAGAGREAPARVAESHPTDRAGAQ